MNILKSREAILALAIIALLAVIASRFPGFVAPRNLARVFTDTSPLILLALGQMVVILTKCIDLSVAANLALCGMVAALMNGAGVPLPLILLTVIALGAALGAVNGVLVWRLGIPSIVVTLGTMTIYRGTIFLLTGGAWINAHQMSAGFKAFPRAVIAGLPVMAWIAVAMVGAVALLLTRTPRGGPSMRWAVIPMRRSIPASRSGERSFWPSCWPARWPG